MWPECLEVPKDARCPGHEGAVPAGCGQQGDQAACIQCPTVRWSPGVAVPGRGLVGPRRGTESRPRTGTVTGDRAPQAKERPVFRKHRGRYGGPLVFTSGRPTALGAAGRGLCKAKPTPGQDRTPSPGTGQVQASFSSHVGRAGGPSLSHHPPGLMAGGWRPVPSRPPQEVRPEAALGCPECVPCGRGGGPGYSIPTGYRTVGTTDPTPFSGHLCAPVPVSRAGAEPGPHSGF